MPPRFWIFGSLIGLFVIACVIWTWRIVQPPKEKPAMPFRDNLTPRLSPAARRLLEESLVAAVQPHVDHGHVEDVLSALVNVFASVTVTSGLPLETVITLLTEQLRVTHPIIAARHQPTMRSTFHGPPSD